MSTKNLLVELFVEELPPKALNKLGDAFASALAGSLKALGLATDASATTAFASPRRLAAHVSAVRERADDRAVSHKLMPVSVGFDAAGRPTPALLKKLAALGADDTAVPQLQRRVDGKAEALFLDGTVPGVSLAAGLQKALDDAIAALPIPKVMAYQLEDGWTSVNFVRPAHGLVALHGADVVPVKTLGLTAGRETEGHRFEASVSPVVLQDADHYAHQLQEQGAVIASFTARRSEIARQLHAAASAQGLVAIEDAALLDEVTALVERPNVLLCHFDRSFLDVPAECLVLTMKSNQKYFPLLDGNGQLTDQFLVVSNISPADPSRVIEGNERVVRPRLADAKFFFDQDRKRTLESRVPGLDKVVYHNQLGSQGERVKRVRAIAREIGAEMGRERGDTTLAQRADLAATLAKADLLTDMVGEFPELQGTMGRYYALHEGHGEDVAYAIEDHYKPRFAGDALPREATGLAVALADKLETVVGLFGIGQVPTGDKDPFALRRHALGIVRMLIEADLPLSLSRLLTLALHQFPPAFAQARAALDAFFRDRLTGYLRESGCTAQEAEAVTSRGLHWLGTLPRRLEALRGFARLPEAPALAAANKRVLNILKKANDDPSAGQGVDAALLLEPAERELHELLLRVDAASSAAYERGDYVESLRLLAALKAPVDAFFTDVMVNVDRADLRANRLGLLGELGRAMNRVADLSKLAA